MHKMITASVLTAATIAGGAALAAPAQAAPGYPSGTTPVRPATTLPVYPSSSGSAVLESPQDIAKMTDAAAHIARAGFDVAAVMKFKPVR